VVRVGAGWRVRVHRANHSNGHPFHPTDLEVEEEVFERDYDRLVVCSGLHNLPRIPEVEGLDTFTGRVLHSSAFRDADDFAGQRVVVVGSGESGSDIALLVARTAAQCFVSMRSAPGTLFPKWIEGNTPDIRDDRLTYNLSRVFKPVILRGQRRFFYKQTEDTELFRWAADSNFNNDRTPFNSNACKSFGIPEAVVRHGAQTRPELASIDGSTVRFADGTRADVDAIVFCTGFKRVFPFFEEAVAQQLVGINHLWKNSVHPDLGDALFLVGFGRPHQINLVTVAELQARMVAQVIGGRKPLPSPEAMRATIEADRRFMRTHYGERFEQNPALVDFLYYTLGVAKFIGCDVPVVESLRKHPRLGLKLLYSGLNGAQFRLQGPGSNWELASKTVLNTPQFQNWPNAVLRWSVLSWLTAASKVASTVKPELRSIHAQARP